MGWIVLIGIKGAVEKGAVEEAVEDTAEEGVAKGAVELVGEYLVIIPGFKVCINNTTRFRAVLIAEALLAAPQIKVNSLPAETISTLEPGLG